ncbi:UDP-2,3-diacylglucosamine diphosphatase [candidate division GN15 bacterium]|nr:UDP-2,3-diacylglucosamine diphosphatase [candidate division GN15 bacterium]
MAMYIFSDVHLGAGTPAEEATKVARIEQLFAKVKADGDRLAILGDLFDFWFEYKHAIPKDHHDVLFMLRDLVKRGIHLDYISGNHDFWMGDYFADQIGVTVHRDTLDMRYAGRRIHLTHGDGLAKADRGYRFLKRVLRNPMNIWLYRKLPPDWAIPLAKRVSGSSRKHTVRRDPTFVPDYEAYARDKLRDGFDVVAIGHLHIPVRKEYDEGVYLNTGDFIEHFTYARIDENSVCLQEMS